MSCSDDKVEDEMVNLSISLKKPCLPQVVEDSPLLSMKTLRSKRGLFQSKLTSCSENGGKRKNLQLQASGLVSANDGENKKKQKCISDSVTTTGNVNGRTVHCNIMSPENKTCDVKAESVTVLNLCPLCYQDMTKKDRVSHFKQCASKNNLSLAQMIDAIDLLKRHSEERKSLGLPTVLQNRSKRKSVSSRVSKSRQGSDPELDLGLALSESMKEADEKYLMDQDEILIEAGLGHEVVAKQASLLEKYGFKTSRPVLPSLKSQRSRSGKLIAETLLLTRSHEERQRLISEKVGSILSAGEGVDCVSEALQDFELKSRLLSNMLENENDLWLKASSSPNSEGKGSDFYVSSLAPFISPSDSKLGSKLKHLSQVQGRKHSPKKLLGSHSEDLDSADYVPNNESLLETVNIPDSECVEHLVSNPNEATKQCSPDNQEIIEKFIEDWRSMLDNPQGSDVTLEGDSYKIHGHKLIFLARCPSIIKEIVCDTKGENHIYLGYSCESVKAFLSFIYCGDTVHLLHLSKVNLDEVLNLAKKFGLKELEHFCELSKLESMECNIASQYEDAMDHIVSAITELENVQQSPDDENKCTNCYLETHSAGGSKEDSACSDNQCETASPCSPDPFADSPPNTLSSELSSKCRKELFKASSHPVVREVSSGNEVSLSCDVNEPVAKDEETDCPSVGSISPMSSVIYLSSNELNESPTGVPISDVNEPNHLSRNMSCNSLKKFLDDSFNDDLGRASLLRSPITPISAPPPNHLKGITSTPHGTSSNGDVTPMPNYDNMDTPHLQKELGKYGIKRLKRQQAEVILKHIYEELHPICETNINASTINMSEQNEGADHPGQNNEEDEEENEEFRDVDMGVECDITGSQERDLSCLVELELCGSGNEASPKSTPLKRSPPMKTDEAETNLPELLQNYIMRDPSMYEKILMFQPIWIEEIQAALKSKTYKPKLEHIMEFLDDEGITFRTMASKERNAGKKS